MQRDLNIDLFLTKDVSALEGRCVQVATPHPTPSTTHIQGASRAASCAVYTTALWTNTQVSWILFKKPRDPIAKSPNRFQNAQDHPASYLIEATCNIDMGLGLK